MVSATLREKLFLARCNGLRQYVLARRANVHPVTLSGIVNSAIPVRVGDKRVIRIGHELGLLPAECFAPDPDLEGSAHHV